MQIKWIILFQMDSSYSYAEALKRSPKSPPNPLPEVWAYSLFLFKYLIFSQKQCFILLSIKKIQCTWRSFINELFWQESLISTCISDGRMLPSYTEEDSSSVDAWRFSAWGLSLFFHFVVGPKIFTKNLFYYNSMTKTDNINYSYMLNFYTCKSSAVLILVVINVLHTFKNVTLLSKEKISIFWAYFNEVFFNLVSKVKKAISMIRWKSPHS